MAKFFNKCTRINMAMGCVPLAPHEHRYHSRLAIQKYDRMCLTNLYWSARHSLRPQTRGVLMTTHLRPVRKNTGTDWSDKPMTGWYITTTLSYSGWLHMAHTMPVGSFENIDMHVYQQQKCGNSLRKLNASNLAEGQCVVTVWYGERTVWTSWKGTIGI